MSREVRRVPKDWQHPKHDDGDGYRPLYDGAGFARKQREWDEEATRWVAGERRAWSHLGDSSSAQWVAHDRAPTIEGFVDWNGQRPDPADYMPEWPEEQRTHLQMYETTTEGTPISPVMATAEELARWCADNRAPAFAGRPASYDAWLAVCRSGSTAGSVHLTRDGRAITAVDAELESQQRKGGK